ncbi:MAG TPA: ion transporter [Verrucomicrobiae bacterium]|nr:ion transporter [Verrucomicrobiae bacterium]
MGSNAKERIHEILDGAPGGDLLCRIVDAFLLTLIVGNVLAVILETVRPIYSLYAQLFHIFDQFSIFVFTVEYLLRIWACPVETRFRAPIRGRLRYSVTPMALIDLLAIIPFYLPFFMPDFRFVRMIRLFRILRILKLGRYSKSLQTFGNVLRGKKEDLVIAFSTVLVLLVFAASLVYLVENDAQPEVFSSIPAAMWWAVVTLTTVGYGDIYPVTPVGKLLGAGIAVLGIGLFALPAGILAAGFAEEIKRDDTDSTCPHCGKQISH